MNKEDIRAFANRDRSDLERLKRAYWGDRFRALGASVTIAAGRALFEYARCVRPDYPSPRERAADLAEHVRLKRLLDRAADAFSRR